MDLAREDKLDQLERILQSRTMQGSESLKSFLKYVALKSINESPDHLKEYTIATEVFGRNNNFSPRSDSVVRVQAGRLRHKLQEYYATEGKSDKILIELPKGHYNPVFTLIDITVDPEQVAQASQPGNGAQAQGAPDNGHQFQTLPAQSSPAQNSTAQASTAQTSLARAVESQAGAAENRKWVRALGAAVVMFAFLTILLAISNISLRRETRGAESLGKAEKFGPVWEPYLKNADQTLLILSNPAVFRFTNARDTEAVLKNSVGLGPEQAQHVSKTIGDKFMIRHSGGRLVLCVDEYTGMGEAIGLANITNLFRSADRGPLLKQSRTVSPEDLKNHNVILLGSVWVNEWSGKLPIKEDFTYTSSATIENLNMQPGEEHEYSPKFDESGKLIEDYGLITVKPNFLYRNTVMVIAGIHSQGTQAAAEYITNPDYLKNLSDRLHLSSDASNPPKYYQALLKVAVDDGMPTTITLLTIHELKAQND